MLQRQRRLYQLFHAGGGVTLRVLLAIFQAANSSSKAGHACKPCQIWLHIYGCAYLPLQRHNPLMWD